MKPEEHTKNREFGSLDMYTVIGGAGTAAGVLIRQGSQSRPSVVSEEAALPEVRLPFRPENVT
jgi:hypothetical protein